MFLIGVVGFVLFSVLAFLWGVQIGIEKSGGERGGWFFSPLRLFLIYIALYIVDKF